MDSPYSSLELASFHSASKGVTGECGIRGGYVELLNIDPYVIEQYRKVRSINLCSNTLGQIIVELMTNPPRKGREDDHTVQLYETEREQVFMGMKDKSVLLTQRLNAMKNIVCQKMEGTVGLYIYIYIYYLIGAMYGFPQIMFTSKTLEVAENMNIAPDLLYCLECLEATGIILVPGSGI